MMSIILFLKVLEGISTWPLLQRNKIEDSKIEEPVRQLVQSDNDRLKELSEKVVADLIQMNSTIV